MININHIFRLVHDREIQLYDGTRLIKHDSYDQLLSNGQTVEELEKNGIYRIHPSFRIFALAEPPSGKFYSFFLHKNAILFYFLYFTFKKMILQWNLVKIGYHRKC